LRCVHLIWIFRVFETGLLITITARWTAQWRAGTTALQAYARLSKIMGARRHGTRSVGIDSNHRRIDNMAIIIVVVVIFRIFVQMADAIDPEKDPEIYEVLETRSNYRKLNPRQGYVHPLNIGR
jgi:hypothetical protein